MSENIFEAWPFANFRGGPICETCRAELTHWLTMVFAPFFFLWNKPFVGWIMIAYALAENVPLIMAQRYNRSRLVYLYRKAIRRRPVK